jgi:hypothetical protein
MQQHGINDPWDLTELDQWVNDATRTDINNVLNRLHDEVFGLRTSDFGIVSASELKDALNFSVNYIFSLKEKDGVQSDISKYKSKGKGWDPRALSSLLDRLSAKALYSCLWV